MKAFSPHAERGRDRFLRAVARDEADAGPQRRARRGEIGRGTIDDDGAGMGQGAVERTADLLLARAAQADEAQHLAGPQVEIDRAGMCRDELADRQARRAGAPLGLAEDVQRRAADDEADNVVGRRLGDRLFAHLQPVTHHHHAVGDAEDLVEPVGDVDHADATGAQPAHGDEEALHLVGRQARGRLVEHQEVAVDDQRAGDGDQRFLGAREAVHARGRVDVAADLRQRRRGACLRRAPVDEADRAGPAGPWKALADAHVLGDRHPFDEAEVLVDEGDGLSLAARLGAVAIGRAANGDLTGIGTHDAAEGLDDGGFAGAVLAEEGDDLAPADREAHALERPRPAERLDDVVEAQRLIRRHAMPPLAWPLCRGCVTPLSLTERRGPVKPDATVIRGEQAGYLAIF